MKKMTIILMIMTACLASPVFAVTGLLNPSFEDSVRNDPMGQADYWTWETGDGFFTPAGTMVYITDDAAGAHSGDDYYSIQQPDGNWGVFYQDNGSEYLVSEGDEVTMGGWFKYATATVNITFKIEYYAEQDQIYDDRISDEVYAFDVTSSDWAYYSHTFAAAPAGANYAKFVIVPGAFGDVVYVDDVSFSGGTNPAAAILVAPSPSGTFVDPASAGANDLTWLKGLAIDPNDDPEVTSDVWLSVDNPDPKTGTKILAGSLAETVTISPPIELDHVYYWQVDSIDPNDGEPDGPGNPVPTEGDIWSFTTINTKPWSEAGFDENAWLNDGSATVNLNLLYNDDVDNYPGPLTRTITTTGGTFDVPDVTLKDPNTITFTAPGVYTITLVANDGALDSDTSSFDITVYAEGTADSYLVAHYPFDTDALDATANNHDGTLVGDAAISAADTQVGAGALSLDGTDDWVAIADSVAEPNTLVTWADFIGASNDELTVAVWIKPAAWSTSYTQVVSKGYPNGYRITRPGDYNSVAFATDQLWDGGTVYGGGQYNMGDGQWHHVVATWDGGAQALYIDGNFQYRNPQEPGTTLLKNGWELQIGANQAADSSQHFNGLIDDVRLYNRGLSHAEVLKLYAAQGGSGTCGGVYTAADLNEDCVINLADFALFAAEWLDCRDANPFGPCAE